MDESPYSCKHTNKTWSAYRYPSLKRRCSGTLEGSKVAWGCHIYLGVKGNSCALCYLILFILQWGCISYLLMWLERQTIAWLWKQIILSAEPEVDWRDTRGMAGSQVRRTLQESAKWTGVREPYSSSWVWRTEAKVGRCWKGRIQMTELSNRARRLSAKRLGVHKWKGVAMSNEKWWRMWKFWANMCSALF